MLLDLIINNLDIFARAGGGGSSGGGQGGIFLLPVVFGYIVAINYRLNKFLGFLVSVVVSVPLFVIFWIIDLHLLALIFFILFHIGFYNGINSGIAKFLGGRKRALNTIRKAKIKDSSWDNNQLIDYAKSIFIRYQNDWQNFNFESMKEYMDQHYLNHAMLMMLAMKQLNRVNKISHIEIRSAIITDAKDVAGKEGDIYSVAFEARVKDKLIDVNENATIISSDDIFAEQWTFIRKNEKWLLSEIRQSTENLNYFSKSLKKFADKNNMYFNLDLGYLLLPTRGILFSKFLKSRQDVNNHVIGYWDNKYIIQLYSYSFYKNHPLINFDEEMNYIVGQISLPKSYGGILVKQNKSNFFDNYNLNIKNLNYRRIKTEWNDFNKRYRIYATKSDSVSALELLNPAFMAWLYDKISPSVFLEVVDNVIYVYIENKYVKKVKGSKDYIYKSMLEVMERIYKELKL